MKKAWILIICLFNFLFQLTAQVKVKTYKYKTVTVEKHPVNHWPVSFGYFSPFLFHSGVSVNTEMQLRKRQVEVNRLRYIRYLGFRLPDRKRTKYFIFNMEPGFFLYRQKDFHTGIMVNDVFKLKWIRYRGLVFEYGFGPGILWTIYQGKTYAVKPDGSIKEKNLAGRIYGNISLDCMVGKDFSKSKWLHHPGVLKAGFMDVVPFPMQTAVGNLGFLRVVYSFPFAGFEKKMHSLIKK